MLYAYGVSLQVNLLMNSVERQKVGGSTRVRFFNNRKQNICVNRNVEVLFISVKKLFHASCVIYA